MFTRAKFLSLSGKNKHKNAAEILKRGLIKEPKLLTHYSELASWLDLPPISERDKLYDRYHYHLKLATITLKEHNFLPEMKRFDKAVASKKLPVAIYLDHLRSAHNVGSILRTAESFGIGNICFCPNTPFIDNQQLKNTAKGVANYLDCHKDFSKLPRPLIAIETHENAVSLNEFEFPDECTIMMGNEEYGLSNESIEMADYIVEIPLVGMKNSINVAAAFAIVAAKISETLSQVGKTS
ncbi:MAG: TrmH family RNA methyltransferase [Rhabdochlamydiaceae bacterium]|nr:TrmH family RNA methyltransferase [Candidatus Amphrikana amoebophyrae]